MFDWIRKRHKEPEQSKESPSTEAVKKFLDDLEKKPGLLSYWHIFPWNLEENDFAEFLKKLISVKTRLKSVIYLEVHVDQLVQKIKYIAKEREEYSKVVADTSVAEPKRTIAEYKLQYTKRQEEGLHERLIDAIHKLESKKQIFDELSRYQQKLVGLHRRFKRESLTLAEIKTEIETTDTVLTGFICNYPGNPGFTLSEDEIKEKLKELES